MEKLLKERTADWLLIDTMIASHLIEVSKYITMDINLFARITGKPIRRVYFMIKSRELPEELIIGGYGNRKQNNKILFDTFHVLIWLRKKIYEENNVNKNYRESLDLAIDSFKTKIKIVK